MAGRVTIDYANAAPGEGEKLERFVPLFGMFAETWDVDVVLHAPHGKPTEPITRSETLHIFFFGCPGARDADTTVGYTKRVYGFPLPFGKLQLSDYGHRIRHGNDVGARILRRSGLNAKVIDSPEGQAIAKVLPKNLWILFDAAHERWDGDEVVVENILDEALPYLIPLRNTAEARARTRRIGKRLRRELENRASEFLIPFTTVALQSVVKTYHECRKECETLEKRQRQLGRAIAQNATEIETLNAILADPKRVLPSDEELRREFESIMRQESARGLTVEDNTFTLTTTLLIGERPDRGTSYPLTEYEIRVSPLLIGKDANKVKGITISERDGAWRGPWKHPVSADNYPYCFGGFANGIWKCFADRKIPELFSLLLTFLKYDTREFSQRSEAEQSRGPYRPPPEPFWASDEERSAAREAYVALAKRSRTQVDRQYILEELAKERAKSVELLRDFLSVREGLRILRAKRDAIADWPRNNETLEKQMALLLEDRRVVGFDIGSGWIQVRFAPANGGENAEAKLDRPMRILMRPLEGSFEAWPSASGEARREASPEKNDPMAPLVEFYHYLFRLSSRGLLGSAVKLYYEFSCGYDERALSEAARKALAPTGPTEGGAGDA